MKILIVDQDGCGLNLATRMIQDGHEVRLYVGGNHERNKYLGKGLVQRVDDWKDHVRWCDFVLLTGNGKYLRDMDGFRRDGILVFGATENSAKWEIDRDAGQKVLEKAGIPTVPFKMFSDYDEAITYVKKTDKRYVSKPAGDTEDKSLSYVSKSPADMVYMLQRWKLLGKLKSAFMLQDFIEGVEFAVSGWIGPEGFTKGWFENFEHKKLMDGEKGPNTGEMGTVIRSTMKSKIADLMLKPLEDMIVASGHTGDIDVNCIVDKKGNCWPLEFTNRCGWPSTNIVQALLKDGEDHAEWMYDLLQGVDSKPWQMEKIVVGVQIAIPDFPYSRFTRKEVVGIPIYGLTEENLPHIHLCDMMLGRAPQNTKRGVEDMQCLVTAGDYVVTVTGTGDKVTEAKKNAYNVIKNISMPNDMMYRLDIGNRLKKQIPQLQKNGYAEGMEF